MGLTTISYNYAGECSDVLSETLEECICSMRSGEQCDIIIDSQQTDLLSNYPFSSAIPAGSSIVYSIELISFDCGKEPWEMCNEERVETASRMKASGSERFRLGDVRAAAVLYSKALKLIIPISSLPDALETVKTLRIVLLLNLAACQLKLEQYGNARENCTKVLELEPDNVKALYRRAQALSSSKDFDRARTDFLRAKQLEPNNRIIVEQLQSMEARAREQNTRFKDALKSMFSGKPA